jgi:cytosine/adenosine deaminase-related metal-dependent hydrolase
MRLLHADALVLGDGAAVIDGAIVIGPGGEIVAAGPAAAVLPMHAGARVERVRGVILPGLVNAHTHLELSALRGRVPGGAGFVPWVEQLIGARNEIAPESDGSAIEQAVLELVGLCTVAVGEVTNSLAAVPALSRAGLSGCVFHEVFGVERAPLEARVAQLSGMVAERLGTWPSTELAYAPSPHTLYTTHPDVVRKLVRTGAERGARLSLHLAEHAAERRFLAQGDGPVAEWYETRLKLRRDLLEWPGQSPVAFADSLGALSPDVILVHLTDARPEELELVARRGCPVVLCPRSNLFIETRLPPLLAIREAGIAAGLGTDSLASNASLDVLAEARALWDRFPSVPASELISMATWGSARALGRTDLGRIIAGARPGLFCIEGNPGSDPCAFVLRNLRAPRRWLVSAHGTDGAIRADATRPIEEASS